MRLTTKGRFAVTAMIDLGMRHQRGPITLRANYRVQSTTVLAKPQEW